MSLNCDVTIGREFPVSVSCVLTDGYSETQPKPKKYLGNKSVKEKMIINATTLLESHDDMQLFAHWWYEELDSGSLDFDIELPVFGTPYVFTVKMLNDISTSLTGSQIREVTMSLEIQNDVGAVIASELSATLCAIQ